MPRNKGKNVYFFLFSFVYFLSVVKSISFKPFTYYIDVSATKKIKFDLCVWLRITLLTRLQFLAIYVNQFRKYALILSLFYKKQVFQLQFVTNVTLKGEQWISVWNYVKALNLSHNQHVSIPVYYISFWTNSQERGLPSGLDKFVYKIFLFP